MLDYSKSFIEEQFPISKISKESYKERKAGASQTLTGLGKWWGRKPLVLVRSIVIGSLLPVSDDKKKDKEVFLELMRMNDASLVERKILSISTKEIYDGLSDDKKKKYFEYDGTKVKWKPSISKDVKAELQMEVFLSMSYDKKLNYCCRPEHTHHSKGINWKMINDHLETNAVDIQDLIEQLSIKKYGKRVLIGDCFSGGGSNIFESARLGCDIYASDLNPIAGLLSWADLNILGCSDDEKIELDEFQDILLNAVFKEIDELGIERKENGDVAKYYLYCNEVICPECGWKVPLLPSYKISYPSNIYAVLIENEGEKRFEFKFEDSFSKQEIKENEKKATVQGAYLICPHCKNKTSINSLKGGGNNEKMRKWEKGDWKTQENDMYTERLYAVKYIHLNDQNKMDAFRKKLGPVTDATFGRGYFVVPGEEEFKNERKVERFLEEHFEEWQEKGYVPSSEIEDGYNTTQPKAERGWQYWHQLFNARQILFLGLLNKKIDELAKTDKQIAIGLMMLNKCCDFDSKLSTWYSQSTDKSENTFLNQALNPLYNYGTRTTFSIYSTAKINFNNFQLGKNNDVRLMDAKDITQTCDIWITDPPYADAVNYEELTEFFISWDKMILTKLFPDKYTDSKRALAIKGVGQKFNESMVEVYMNLTQHMNDDGMQVVMFTHQDTKVWAELAMILWSSGLQVTAAWCVQTETNAGLRKGNYVQGTVIMILRKQSSQKMIFKDELYEEIRDEVKLQIDSMRDIDQGDNPDFSDGDYLLAAYVAALKILTSYKNIAGLDVQYELQKARENSEDSPVTKLINVAKKEAYDYLVPTDIPTKVWKHLSPEERFYIKKFEIELKGNRQMSSCQEIARGFGVIDYTSMLASTKANAVRIKNASEYKMSSNSGDRFSGSLLRNILMSVYVAKKEDDPIAGRYFLKGKYEEANMYWEYRNMIIDILSFLGKAKNNSNMPEWDKDAEYALMLREALRNDCI